MKVLLQRVHRICASSELNAQGSLLNPSGFHSKTNDFRTRLEVISLNGGCYPHIVERGIEKFERLACGYGEISYLPSLVTNRIYHFTQEEALTTPWKLGISNLPMESGCVSQICYRIRLPPHISTFSINFLHFSFVKETRYQFISPEDSSPESAYSPNYLLTWDTQRRGKCIWIGVQLPFQCDNNLHKVEIRCGRAEYLYIDTKFGTIGDRNDWVQLVGPVPLTQGNLNQTIFLTKWNINQRHMQAMLESHRKKKNTLDIPQEKRSFSFTPKLGSQVPQKHGRIPSSL